MSQSFTALLRCAVVTVLTLSAATNATDGDAQAEKDLHELIALFQGEFNNEAQVMPATNGSLAGKKPESYGRLYHYRMRIDSPHLSGEWIYAQANKEDQHKAYRQNVLEFYIDDEGVIRSRAWRFKATGMKDKGMPSAQFLSQLSPDQLEEAFPDTCSTEWHRRGAQFEGSIDPRNCIIQSKYKNEKRQLFAEEIIFTEGMWAREGAYRMDGELAFGLTENQFYKYLRTR